MKVPILTYHSHQAGDHRDILSFEEHLEIIAAEGFRVFPLRQIVDALIGKNELPDRAVGVSCDDGKRYDYFETPSLSKSMLSVLRKFRKKYPWQQRAAELSCFVIADPNARNQIALGDRELLSSAWWPQAATTGCLVIENHSFDHVHSRVERAQGSPIYDNDFSRITTVEEADRQIALAARVIDNLTGNRPCRLFAYPFGQTNRFMVDDYFPTYRERHGMLAAFTTNPEPILPTSCRWMLPRYVANYHIRSDMELVSLLLECKRSR